MPTVKLHLWTLDPADGYEFDLPDGWPIPNVGEGISIKDHDYLFIVTEKSHLLDINEIVIFADDERKKEKD